MAYEAVLRQPSVVVYGGDGFVIADNEAVRYRRTVLVEVC